MAARSRAESWPGGAPDGLGCPAPMHGVQRAMLQFAGRPSTARHRRC